MLTTIRLYGYFGRKFGRKFELAVSNAAEAVRALCVQLPGFEQEMANAHEKGVGFAVFYGKENLSQDNLLDPTGGRSIRIAPMVIGAKNQGIGSIILGVVLIVVGVWIGVGSGGTAGLVAQGLVSAGVGMIVGGVVQLLTPSPKVKQPSDGPNNQANYSFSGPVNTQAQGNPVPLIYGEVFAGSATISAGINIADNAYVPTADSYGGGTARWNEIARGAIP